MLELNQKKGLVLFMVIVLVSMAVVAWSFWLNRGTLVLVGAAPYAVAGDFIESRECLSDRCELRLVPGEYVVEMSKEGYISQELSLRVARWRTSEQPFSLKKQPTIVALGPMAEFIYGSASAPVIGQAPGLAVLAKKKQIDLVGLPPGSRWLAFRNDASEVLTSNDASSYSLFDVETGELRSFENLPAVAGMPAEQPGEFLYLTAKKGANDQVLFLQSAEGAVQLSTFPHEVSQGRFFIQVKNVGTGDESKSTVNSKIVQVIFVDESAPEKSIYAIDAHEKSKLLLAQVRMSEITFASLSGSGKYLWLVDKRGKSLLYDVVRAKALTEVTLSSLAVWRGDELIFVDNAEREIAGGNQVLFKAEDIAAKIKRPVASAGEDGLVQSWALFSYAPDTNSFMRITDFPEEISSIERLSYDRELYVLSRNEIYQVIF